MFISGTVVVFFLLKCCAHVCHVLCVFSSTGVRCLSNSLSTFCYLAAQGDLLAQFVDRRVAPEVRLLCGVPHATHHHDADHAGDEEDARAVYGDLHVVWRERPQGFLRGCGREGWERSGRGSGARRRVSSPRALACTQAGRENADEAEMTRGERSYNDDFFFSDWSICVSSLRELFRIYLPLATD